MPRVNLVFCGIMKKFIRKEVCPGCGTYTIYSKQWHEVRDKCPEYLRWVAVAESRKLAVANSVAAPGKPKFRLERAIDGAEY